MSKTLIYWPHNKTTRTVEEYTKLFQRPYTEVFHYPFSGPKKELSDSVKEEIRRIVEDANEIAKKPYFYTEEQFERLEKKPKLEDCYTFNLRPHSIDEDIPNFHGFTPRFCLDESGFKYEGRVDLLKHVDFLENTIDEELNRVKRENLEKASLSVGEDKSFEIHRQKLEEISDRLNSNRIDFIVYRSWRGFPPWDNVDFYSQGRFKI